MPTTLRSSGLRRQIIALAALVASPVAFAGAFSHTDAGPYEYTDTANWGGAVIGNNWTSSLTANQTITFATDYTIADQDGGSGGSSSSWIINNTGLFNHTFIGSGANRTVTLGGQLSLGSSTTNANKVTIGSLTAGQQLNIELGASRTFFVGTNRTLDVLNVISSAGNYNLTKTGTGTLRLLNESNSFTSYTQINEGTVEVTKVSNSGDASSLGTASDIRFGGAGGTLRYVGIGDSTNRSLVIGGSGVKIDSSGTGALKFTNAAGHLNGSTGSARTFTLLGTNDDDNTMSIAFNNAGSGVVSLSKQGTGRWILAGANTYTGTTSIEAGTLELGAADRISDSSNLILNGGTFASGGFDETFGTLTVGGNATIDFGASDISDLVFGDSSSAIWGESVSLSIVNFNGLDSIRFGEDQFGLSMSQLGKITINGFSAAIDSQGYLSAIPEPSSFAALAGLSILGVSVGLRRRRSA